MQYLAIIALCLIMLFLGAVALYGRKGPPAPANPCKRPGCEIERRHRNDAPLSRESEKVRHA